MFNSKYKHLLHLSLGDDGLECALEETHCFLHLVIPCTSGVVSLSKLLFC